MEYLFKRCGEGVTISSMNVKMFDSLKTEYPDVHNCSLLICDYFKKELKVQLNEEELLYLMLHINRICSREDCYQ
jgi:beta-glucoside operon transcriptional antiterminator